MVSASTTVLYNCNSRGLEMMIDNDRSIGSVAQVALQWSMNDAQCQRNTAFNVDVFFQVFLSLINTK